MHLLPKYTLIRREALFYPAQDEDSNYVLRFQSTSQNFVAAAPILSHLNPNAGEEGNAAFAEGVVTLDGSLYEIEMKKRWSWSREKAHAKPTDIEALLKEEYIALSNYQDFFLDENVSGIQPEVQDALRESIEQIWPDQREFYFVLEKGHYNVAMHKNTQRTKSKLDKFTWGTPANVT